VVGSSPVGWQVCGGSAGPVGSGLEGWQAGSGLHVLSVYYDVDKLSNALGVQGAEVSILPCGLPQPSIYLVSQQGP
jgi:hypothetical protein